MKNWSLAAIIGIVGAGFAFAACGSSKDGSSSSASDDTFVLSEFTVVPPTNALRSGSITITADNVGGEVHELVIARATNQDALPKKSDGTVDEAKIAATDKVGGIEDIAAGAHKSETFDLTAGTYVAFCNIVDAKTGGHSDTSHGSETGHVHYAEGMHVTFTVS